MKEVKIEQCDEHKLWSEFQSNPWETAIGEGSIFKELYQDTISEIEFLCEQFRYDVVLDVGCGTGDILGSICVPCDRIGIDINPAFIESCKDRYDALNNAPLFEIADATKLVEWWRKNDMDRKYSSPLIICCNNTLMIMPDFIRDEIVNQMQLVAGQKGSCYATFWNGAYFPLGVVGFYKSNPDLCGVFDHKDPNVVNIDKRVIRTSTGYTSEWFTMNEVARYFNSLLIFVDKVNYSCAFDALGKGLPHVHESGIGIMVYFNGKTQVNDSAKDYYDSDDAQTFYSAVWGEDTIHIGRYDLVYANEKLSKLPLNEQVHQAQYLQEAEMIKQIKKCMGEPKFRCIDFGCGYGGLLREMARNEMLWSGLGIDVSTSMIEVTLKQNAKELPEIQALLNAKRESYLDVSAVDESTDCVISMDAFLHVGPALQRLVVKEASRVLRPGGWLIFTDIMQRNDAPLDLLAPLHARIGLSSFGSVDNYFAAGKDYGFGNMNFIDNSANVTHHYGTILKVFKSVSTELVSKGGVKVNEDFCCKMINGLNLWKDNAPETLQWGIISMQKLNNI